MTTPKLRAAQLQQLLDASKLLNSTLDVNELLGRITETACELAGADRATLYIVDHETEELWTRKTVGGEVEEFRLPLGTGLAGRAAKTGRLSNLRDAHLSRHFYRELDKKMGYRTKSLLTVPFRGRDEAVVGVIQVLNQLKRGVFSKGHEYILRQLGEYAALALENAMFVEALHRQQELERDLVAAQSIQLKMLPRKTPQSARLQVAARYRACQEVGGDLYDFVEFENGQIGVAVGDISGKGLTAALMMANLQALFRMEARRGGAPHEVLSAMNSSFHESTASHQFATYLYAVVDPEDGHVRYCSAGHDPPVLVKASGKVVDLPVQGLLLGVLADTNYQSSEAVLDPGDVFVLYTDGITEQHDASDEQFGRPKLLQAIRSARGLDANALADAVDEAVRAHAGTRSADDDFTLVVLRRPA